MTDFRPFIPYALGAVLVGTAYGYGHHRGVNSTELEWQGKWNKQALALATAKAEALEMVRAVELRRQSDIEKVRQDAEQEIARAKTDAASADAASERLQQQAKRLAARASQCAGNTGTTIGGQAAGTAALVLADLLSRADKRAGELAAAYDQARNAGLACERAYDALMSKEVGSK